MAVALLVGACSGRSGGGGGPGPAAPDAGGTPTTTVDTRFSGAGSEDFCRRIRAYAEGTRRLGQGSDIDLRAIYSDVARAVAESATAAPAEIRRDVEVVADAFTALVRELEAVNYDFTRLPPAVALRFMSEELSTATVRVEAYARNVCGVSG